MVLTWPELKIIIHNFAILVSAGKMLYTSITFQFISILANENQNIFIGTICAVPSIHFKKFTLLSVLCCGPFFLRQWKKWIILFSFTA